MFGKKEKRPFKNVSESDLKESLRKAAIVKQIGLSTDGYPLTESDRNEMDVLVGLCEKELSLR